MILSLSLEQEALLAHVKDAMEGYIFLEMPEEALKESYKLPPLFQKIIYIVTLQIEALIKLKEWEKAEEIVKPALLSFPESLTFLVQYMFVLHQQKKSICTWENLLVEQGAGHAYYQLAQLSAIENDLPLAKDSLKKAFAIDPALKNACRTDDTFKSLREEDPEIKELIATKHRSHSRKSA